MKPKIIRAAVPALALTLILGGFCLSRSFEEAEQAPALVPPEPIQQVCLMDEPVIVPLPPRLRQPAVEEEPELPISEEEIELIALLTMGEAEGECEEGQRLVIDTVLNRMDDSDFPDTVEEVVYQPHQYAGIQSPRVEECWVKEELVQLVREELEDRSDSQVIFFRTKRYSSYGTPLFQVGNHYFSGK